MKENPSRILESKEISARYRRVQWITILITSITITVLVLWSHYFGSNQETEPLLIWFIAELSANAIIFYASRQIGTLRTQNENQLQIIHEVDIVPLRPGVVEENALVVVVQEHAHATAVADARGLKLGA